MSSRRFRLDRTDQPLSRILPKTHDRRNQQTTRAIGFTTIKEILDPLPRAYTKELYDQMCDAVYQPFYESYMGQAKSLHAVN